MQQIQWDKMNWEIRHSTHYAKKLDMQGLIPPVSVASAWNQLFLLGTLGTSPSLVWELWVSNQTLKYVQTENGLLNVKGPN